MYIISYRLYEILSETSKQDEHKTLVFVTTKRKADFLARVMRNANWPAEAIHGDKTQGVRDNLLNSTVFSFLVLIEI